MNRPDALFNENDLFNAYVDATGRRDPVQVIECRMVCGAVSLRAHREGTTVVVDRGGIQRAIDLGADATSSQLHQAVRLAWHDTEPLRLPPEGGPRTRAAVGRARVGFDGALQTLRWARSEIATLEGPSARRVLEALEVALPALISGACALDHLLEDGGNP